jgi:osmoprotectant transport system substrate-binding protein
MRLRRRVAALAAMALVAVLAGCGGGADSNTSTSTRPASAADAAPITIGAKNFTEQAILGELYRQALVAKGYRVVLKPDIGSTEIIHRALRNGSLDMYPEYVGVLLSEIANVRQRPRSATAAYDVARAYEEKGGFTLLAQTPLEDTNALGVKPQFAKRHGLRTIADLKRLPGTVEIGALPEFASRFEGLRGLRAVYGLKRLRVRQVDSGGRYAALDGGDVDVASVFSSDGQLMDGKYVVLADPRRLFASGHVAPIVTQKVLEAHGPALRTTIDAVSAKLTTAAMRRLNADVDVKKRAPLAVATEFLRAQGLL